MADFSILFLKTVAVPAAKLLLKRALNDTAVEFGSGAIDYLSAGAETALSGRDRTRIRHTIDELVQGVLDKLDPVFAAESSANLNTEAVAFELASALNGQHLAQLIVQKQLHPEAVLKAIEQDHPTDNKGLSEAEQALYQRALGLTVPCLVEIANQLPGFDVANARATLTQLDALARTVDSVLTQVQPISLIAEQVSELVGHQRAEQARRVSVTVTFERRYVAAVRRHLNTFDLMGIAEREETGELELSTAYIPLGLSYTGKQDEDTAPRLFENVLNRLTPERSGLIVEGPAGSGKTTLLRWAGIQAGVPVEEVILTPTSWKIGMGGKAERLIVNEGWEEDADPAWRHCIPFFIRLRDYQDGQLPLMADYHQAFAAELPAPSPDWVETVLNERRALVIWDGADEIPTRFRQSMLRGIRGMIESYPGNVFLLSTRPGVRLSWALDLGFQQAEIQPMSLRDVEQFVERWHQSVAQVLRKRSSARAHQMPKLGQELVHKLYDEPAILRLATNPLLCSAICSLNYQDRGHLPDKQHHLCEKLCEMLLHGRDLQRGIMLEEYAAPYAELGYDAKKQLAQHLAYEMVQNGRSTITAEQAEGLIRERLPGFIASATEQDAHDVAKTLIERGGVLRAYRGDSVEFVHNTLKEYLAAQGFVGGLVDRLAENALQSSGQGESTWHNVAVFAAAVGREPFPSSLIEKLLEPTLKGQRDRRRLILVLRCMAVATELKTSLRQRQLQIEGQLFPPRNMSEAGRLADIGERVVRFLRPRPRLGARQLAACVRALRLIGTRNARDTLQQYLDCPHKSVVSELIQAVNPLDIPAVVAMATQTNQLPDEYRRYIDDLRPLAGRTDIQILDLDRTSVRDVSPLRGLTNLRTLFLMNTSVRDVSALLGLTSLQTLDLSGTSVRDVSPLQGLTNMQGLYLDGTSVRDVSPLRGLTNLTLRC